MLNLLVEERGNITVINLAGKLNAANVSSVQDDILAKAGTNCHVLLDLSHVDYLSSAGIRMLLLLYRRILDHNGMIALAGLNEDVRDVMEITGFMDLFTVYDNLNDGLKALKKVS